MRIIMGRRLKKDERGVSNIIVVVLSLIIIVVIVANVILWSYQMNQLDWEKMQESVSIENVTRITSTSYNSSGYNLIGSTTHLSGTVGNLVSNDGVYMTFRSYVSATSTTSKTDAFIAYRDSTTSLDTPKERTWTGDTVAWGLQSEMSTASSPVRWVRTAVSPKSERALERIVITLSDDGYLDAYVFDGTSWTTTNDIGFVGTAANAYKSFDIAYEKTSGEALLVYSIAPATNFRVGYKTWSLTSGWSSENTYVIGLGTTQTAYWITMASKPTSDANEIAVGVIGDSTSLDAYGLIWNGTAFSSQQLLTGTVSIATEECIAVAYEQISGYATFVSSTGNNAFSWQWSGSVWDASATTFDLTGAETPNWFTLKANPINDELLAVAVAAGQDLDTAYWSGSAWTLHAEHEGSLDTDAQRPADFAWEPTGSQGLLVFGKALGKITRRTFTAPNTWGAKTDVTMGANAHPWVQLRTNPRSISGDITILGIVLEGTVFDIGAIKWDGTTFTVIGSNTISSDTTTIAYEGFEIEFQEFGPPTEFTSEVEFTGISNTQSWIQLVWNVDSAWTTESVAVTLQLYNYALGNYSTGGNGYLAYTSSVTADTDETKNQTITVNPTQFRDASGNWKMKIKGVKSTSVQFDSKVDWVEFKPGIGPYFTLKNKGALTSHIVSLWVTNSTYHQRYTVDIFLNSGETLSYYRADIHLPSGQYIAKIVTERGNAAVYS